MSNISHISLIQTEIQAHGTFSEFDVEKPRDYKGDDLRGKQAKPQI